MSEMQTASKLGAPACDACPFRASIQMVYDEDAMNALNDGWEPSCHKLVGMSAIFNDPFPTFARCRGYDSWLADECGFVTPTVVLSQGEEDG